MPDTETTKPAEVTPPVEETKATDAQPEQNEQDTFDREYVEKLRQEAAKYRTQLREKEEAEKAAAEAKRKAEQTAEERAKEAEAKAEKALADAEARVKAAERRAALAGKVNNPDRVMRLMDNPDDYFNDDGQPNEEKILTDFPEYAPAEPTKRGPSIPAPKPAGGAAITQETLARMSQTEINDRWDEIQTALGKKK